MQWKPAIGASLLMLGVLILASRVYRWGIGNRVLSFDVVAFP